MKKLLSRTTLTLIALTIVGFAVMPEWAHAAGWLEGPITSVFNNSVAIILNLILQLTSSLVYVSGVLLSLSINLTLHVGDFFKDAPALRGVWILIRNLSSIGIIFILLYTSILTIVGVSSTGDIKKIVGKIIMAGLLINFSLFFVNIAIDASNLVSLQFYRAIAPQSTTAYTVGAAFTDGGLSNVFMSSLKIPRIYQQKDFFKGTDVFASISIATLGGIIMMITAAISFAAASLAFMYRTAVLLFIMALSPIYFVAMIFPQLEDKSKKLVDIFKTQLFFMPTYLFLMYVALRFVGDPSFSKIFNIGATSGTGAGTPMFIGTMIQYVIALVFINAPLVAAISMGVAGAKSVPSVNSVAGWFKKGGASTWRNTGGAMASKAANSESLKEYASKSKFGELMLKSSRGVAKNYSDKLEKDTKQRTAFSESLGQDKEIAKQKAILMGQNAQLKAAKDRGAPLGVITQLETNISGIKDKIKALSNRRQGAYANRISSRGADTLWLKLAKNTEAAQEIQKKIDQADIDNLKKKIDDEKPNLNRLEAKLRANTGGTGDPLSTEEERYLNELRTNLSENQAKISKLELKIANL